jgi:hypothetical protein
MQSPTKDRRLPEIRLPEFERPTFEMPSLDLSGIDLPHIDVPKIDVGKAIAGAATAVGLAKPRRSRWPFVLGAGVVVAVAGLIVINSATIRERLNRAKTSINERVSEMRAGDEYLDPVAFTAANTKPIKPSRDSGVSDSPAEDYPDGLGASTEPVATNGRSAATTAR